MGRRTIIDRQVVPLNESGRPGLICSSASALKLHASTFISDLLAYNNRDLTGLPLIEHRQFLNPELQFCWPRIWIVAVYFRTSSIVSILRPFTNDATMQ